MAHQFTFGTGNIYILPSGVLTPIQVAAIQNISVDFDGDQKSLYGQSQFPLDTARGKVKVAGKFEVGQINSTLWNSVFFGATAPALGQVLVAVNEGPTAIPASPYAITVTNSANFLADLGVTNNATGVQMTDVAATTTPTAGQYHFAAGVYTFSAADLASAISVNITYEYTSTTTGKKFAINNQLMGNNPVFELDLYNSTKSKSQLLRLFACTSSKFQFPLKQDDYGMQVFDFNAQDNGAGNIAEWSTTEG